MTEPMTLHEVIEARAEILNRHGGTGNPLADLAVKVCDRLIVLMDPSLHGEVEDPEKWKGAARESYDKALRSGLAEEA